MSDYSNLDYGSARRGRSSAHMSERRRRKRRKRMIRRIIFIAAALIAALLLFIGVRAIVNVVRKNSSGSEAVSSVAFSGGSSSEQLAAETETETAEETETTTEEETTAAVVSETIAQAQYLAATYDYDGAIELLSTCDDPQAADLIQEYTDIKATCYQVDPYEVTHIFYHSLVVDPSLAFAGDDSIAAGFKQWMTTVTEFNRITQKMYDDGYVMISLHDMAIETVDENGVSHFTANDTIYLPEGKKAFVLSLDDLCYYHSYDNHGIASKLIVGDDGRTTCEYILQDGTTVTGSYDCVPLMNDFIDAHPDYSYHGAKGIIALTGYDGILGYRTDYCYRDRVDLDLDQQVWLDEHPDFDWNQECEEAKKVAENIKSEGWEFASHTWGHIKIADSSYESLVADTEKWLTYVAPLIGGTDTIIFAHGQDLTDWHDYDENDAKFQYLKSMGFNYFCLVDSSQYFVQIRDDYVRMGRRNLDGYRLWTDAHSAETGYTNHTSDLFDASEILDEARTDVPDL